MFADKKKIGTNLDLGKLEKRVLRLFRADSGFQAYVVGSERTGFQELQSDYNKESRSAMLKAEYLKGKALMNLQNTRRFC